MTSADLLPGDVLLYKASGVYGWIIRFHTGHPISHVECYVGNGQSAASRDGKGTAVYPLRTDGLVMVCRPILPFDVAKALAWFAAEGHKPYGWADLLQFIDVNVDTDGIVCSPFVTELLRAGGLDPFNGEPAEKIAPFQFETSNVFRNLLYNAPTPAPLEVV
jgi:hypothetical protein